MGTLKDRLSMKGLCSSVMRFINVSYGYYAFLEKHLLRKKIRNTFTQRWILLIDSFTMAFIIKVKFFGVAFSTSHNPSPPFLPADFGPAHLN
jgi:hypothetical protein